MVSSSEKPARPKVIVGFALVTLFITTYTIILLRSDIPVPSFKNAVIMLLSAALATASVLAPLCHSSSRAVAFFSIILSIALTAATLGVTCVRWRQALETADEWAVPHNIDPSLIPGNVNSDVWRLVVPGNVNLDLWKLVRNREYGIGVIVGAALDLAVNVLNGLVAVVRWRSDY
ncbi:hypothetical protein RB597_000094 [Gaeumannomyces tritici]